MSYLYLDIETTGLPPKDSDWKTDYERFPRIVQLAWKMNGNLKSFFIVQPLGFKIPKEATLVHGITDKICKLEGYTLRYVLSLLLLDAMIADYIVGHNVYFDTSTIKACMLREYSGKLVRVEEMDEALHRTKRIDTMKIGHKLIGGKWPNLTELHTYLFKKAFIGVHTADGDINAVEKCHIELIRRKAV